MPYYTQGNLGKVIVSNEVVARIAGYAVISCAGIVGMAAKNMKDGIVQLLKRESLTKGVHLEFAEDGLHLDFHIIVEYGTNIVAIGEIIVSNVKYNVEEMVGIKLAKVNIFVEGVRVDK